MSGDCIVKDSHVSIFNLNRARKESLSGSSASDPKMESVEGNNMTHSERTANQFPLLLQPANPSNEGCSFSSRGSLGRSHRRQKGPRYFPAGSRHSLRNKRGKQLHRFSRSHLVIPTKNCAIRQASLMQPDNSFISFWPLYLIPAYHSSWHFSL